VPKVWSGTAWVEKPVKVHDGTSWKTRPVKIWDGSQWRITPTPSSGYPILRFDKVGDFAPGVPLPTTNPGTLVPDVSGMPLPMSALPIKAMYLLSSHIEMDWTATSFQNYYLNLFNDTVCLQGSGARIDTVNLGGGKWGLNGDYNQVLPAVLDPAAVGELTFRERATASAADNVLHDATHWELTPLLLDAQVSADQIIPKPTATTVYATLPWNILDISGFGYDSASQMIVPPVLHSQSTSRPTAATSIAGQFTLITDVAGSYSFYFSHSGNSNLTSITSIAMTPGVPYVWNYTIQASNSALWGSNMWPKIGVAGSMTGATVTVKAGGKMTFVPPP
jgi:hypothetical protein